MSLAESLTEALDLALLDRRSVLAVALLGLAGAVVSAFVSAEIGAVVIGTLLLGLVACFLYALYQRTQYSGPYQLLSHASVWDLEDPDASTGWHTMRNEVCFNYPAAVVQEQVWGTGDNLFDDYTAEHGQLVDTRPVHNREIGIVLLSDPPDRNDRRRLVSHRRLSGMFPGQHEWIEVEIPQRCPKVSIEVRFPLQRAPTDLKLTSSITSRRSNRERVRRISESDLDTEHGRKVFRLKDHNPGRVWKYGLTWSWAVAVVPQHGDAVQSQAQPAKASQIDGPAAP